MSLRCILINKFQKQLILHFTMTQNTSISIKDRIAMFQKLNSGSVPSFPQKKEVVSATSKPNPIPVPQKGLQTKNSGQVESPPIVKPNMIKQSQQTPLTNNPNGSPNKLASSFSNNPWVQKSSTAKVEEKKTPVPPVASVKQAKGQTQQVITLKNTFSEQNGNEVGKSQPQKIVKITENALVDKQSLPSQNAMKLLIEGRLSGFKKPQQPPKKVILDFDSSPKQTPVVESDVKIGNVKANTEKFNHFFQTKESQKLQAQNEQANRRKQAQLQALQSQKEKESQPPKELSVKKEQHVEQVGQQNNCQNINVGMAFSQPVFNQPQPNQSIPQSSVLPRPVLRANLEQSAANESKEAKGEDNSLATRLKKRKKMTKASFDSDED